MLEIRAKSHVGNVQMRASGLTPSGAAATAEKLLHARKIGLAGDTVGSAEFDGSRDVEVTTVVETLTNEELEAMLL